MKKTPKSERFHISFIGKTNSGKSSLLNTLTKQEVSIVSEEQGTTTDPVEKKFELLDAGAVVFIDTAGFGDTTSLGLKREEKSWQALSKSDLVLITQSVGDFDYEWFKEIARTCKKLSIRYKMVFTKIDTIELEQLSKFQLNYPDALFLSIYQQDSIDHLITYLSEQCTQEDKHLVSLPYGSKVLLVIPIDSEAPKGRIIHPQVQVIRDCLDQGIEVTCVRDTELAESLKRNPDIDLVITDSQIFSFVNKTIPQSMALTSFSILFSKYKGEFSRFYEGLKILETLRQEDKIAITESCSHNISCEDIGRFKIPKKLEHILGFSPKIDFFMGNDFPKNCAEYKLIIHCGACMTNRQTVLSRIKLCEESNTAITNYGLFLAYATGILDRITV